VYSQVRSAYGIMCHSVVIGARVRGFGVRARKSQVMAREYLQHYEILRQRERERERERER
jgi:hypothetical protein